MTYRISKFLTIGLLIFSVQYAYSSENNNVTNNMQVQNNNIRDDYSIPIDVNTQLTKEEIEEFFENLKTNSSSLNNLKYQLYSIECNHFEKPIFDAIIEGLYEYFQEIHKSKNSNLHDFYIEKLSNYRDDKRLQIIILINECLNNPAQQIKMSNFYNTFRKDTINDASEIYNNIVTKIVRGINLSEKLIQAKKNIIKYTTNKKQTNKNNIITFSNQGKCWFMAYFSFLIAMYDQSDASDPIRNTNFGKFVNYLHNKQNEFTRKIDTQYKRIVIQDKYRDFDYLKKGKWKNHKLRIGYNEYFYPSSNVIGERVDLFSELLLYYWGNNKDIIDQLDKINNISEIEKNRRNKALELIGNLYDLYYGVSHTASSALMIILNLFPELKRFIGNGPVKGVIDSDSMIYCSENTALDNNELKEEHIDNTDYYIMSAKNKIAKREKYIDMIENIQKKIIDKDSNKYKELQVEKKQLEKEKNTADHNMKFYKRENKINTDFSISNGFVSYWNFGHIGVLMDINNGKVFSNKQHLLFEIFYEDTSINDLVNGYRYITHYNNDGELETYELISVLLSNSGHAICFAKTGKSDFEWSGIDSSLAYNDNNYTLDDIVYNEKLVEINSEGKVLKDNNTYLSKMYHVKNDGIIYVEQRQFYPVAVLYKKVSEKEIKKTIDNSNKIEENFLSDFCDRISFTILDYEKNKKELIKMFNSNIKDNELIEFCKKTILKQIDIIFTKAFDKKRIEKTHQLLNNKECEDEVNDIIHNNIYYIVSKYYKELYDNTKLDDINFNINDIVNNIPQKANFWYKHSPQDWLSNLKYQIKREYVISNIKNTHRNNYIGKVLIGAFGNGMRDFMINNYKFDYCILSSIQITTSNYFDFRKKYNSEIFSIIKEEFEEMNPSWNMENISRICNLIKNGYITNPDVIKYMKEHYMSKLEK